MSWLSGSKLSLYLLKDIPFPLIPTFSLGEKENSFSALSAYRRTCPANASVHNVFFTKSQDNLPVHGDGVDDEFLAVAY